MLNTTNTEFSSIKVWFTDQNSKQFEIDSFLPSVRKFRDKYGKKLMDTAKTASY